MGLAVLVLALLTSADADNICEDERPLKCVRFGEQCEALSACGEWSADCNDCDPNITDSDWKEVDHKWIKFLRGNGCHALDSNCLATSVDHTLLYANQAHCEVLVKAEAGLEFTRFHTEDNWDEVELVSLTDGQVLWTGSGRLGAFALPVVLETTTAFMWKTDATTQSKGWKACSGCPDAAQDTPDGQCQCVVAKGLETSCVDYNYTLRLAGLDFPWLTNCSTFDPKCRTCRCLSTTGRNKLQVRLIIRGMFQWMSHLVLWVAVAAPLPVALYLIITCLLAASDLCNVDRDSCREAVLRWTAWTSHVLRNGCCRGQNPCGRISGFWYLTCVQCFWVWFQFKLWTEPQRGVTGLDLLAPMILWLFFCLSSGMIWYWHKLALKNASEEQDMETWVGGCRCFVCCCCFCNPLGCCFPMEVTDAHSAPPTLDAEKGQSPGQQSMESPEGTDSMLTIGKSQIGQLFKGLFSEEDKQKHSERFERLAHVSEEVDADSPYLMIWLWRIFLGGSPVHFKGSLVLVALHLTFWALVLAATSWAYENTFYSRARTMEDVYLEALGPGYKAPPSLHDPRVTLLADDGSILQGPRIVAGKRLYDAIHRFVPVVRNFTSSMRILPACLVVHYWCLALSVLIHAHFSRQRLRAWLGNYGPRGQWKHLEGYAEQPEYVKLSARPLSEDTDPGVKVAGFEIYPKKAALPKTSDTILQVGVATSTVLLCALALCVCKVYMPLVETTEVSSSHQEASLLGAVAPAKMPESWGTRHLWLVYLLTWLPLIPYRMINGLFLSAEFAHLIRKATRHFDATSEEASPDGRQLGIIEWKVGDMCRDWFLLLPCGLLVDCLSVLTGLIATCRLIFVWQAHDFAPVLVANCLTLLVLVVLQLKPVVHWNGFLLWYHSTKDNIHPVLFICLSRGVLNFKVLGLALTPAYFVGLAVSVGISAGTAAARQFSGDFVQVLTSSK